MYVWSTGWDNTVLGCDEAKFLASDEAANPECYTGTWDTEEKRSWLWKTLARPGTLMFVYIIYIYTIVMSL